MRFSDKTALKLPPETIDRLRTAARRRSYQQEEDYSWARLARELLTAALVEEEKAAAK